MPRIAPLARRPEILRAFVQLAGAINGPGSTIEPQLRNLVSQMASRAAGCGYCMAHTAHTADRVGVSAAKEEARRARCFRPPNVRHCASRKARRRRRMWSRTRISLR